MDHIHVQVQTQTYVVPERNINVQYPLIYGHVNPGVQQTINQTIMNTLNRLIHDDLTNPDLVELDGWYEIKTNERGILSLAMYAYAFTGGAHGMTTIQTLTFDVTSGKQYQLQDLFNPNSDYTKVLTDIINKQIQQRDIQMIVDSVPAPGNQSFYIADKCLVIYYQLYDLAPYVYGIPYFPISIYEIQDIIDENGPLGQMMGSF
ncbi:DUF3298 and DUF4163 domain-containing protein [Tuberibacillus sp. Marseille-P3662]|uniref:DUF3298 and DUF4163 domain-containing protein n=1 Tax=Tuberibacillus sp. Marseille-P3662 TaxID=1965358 RepID=UPI000A1CB72D|nr:DUF3298 and DUF4163 domain-containing protein [Tuberibacillus sp. Marseille-P3662]